MDTKKIYIVEYVNGSDLISFENLSDALCYVATEYLDWLGKEISNAKIWESEEYDISLIERSQEELTSLFNNHFIEDYVYIIDSTLHLKS